MELHFTPEQEAHILEIAQHQGKTPEQLVLDATGDVFEGDRRFRESVQRGIAQADAGQFIEDEEMNARFARMIHG